MSIRVGVSSVASVVGLLVGLGGAVALEASPPVDETKQRVENLVKELDAPKRSDREKAGEALRSLGADAIEYLPALDDRGLSAEQHNRLKRLLPALWDAKRQRDVEGSRIGPFAKKLAVEELLLEIEEATGNRMVDMRLELNQPISDALVSLPKETTFWQALDQMNEQAGTSYFLYPQGRALGISGNPGVQPPVDYAGALRLAVSQIVLRNVFQPRPDTSCRVDLQVLVEPRLKPLAITVPFEKFAAILDKGEPLAFARDEELTIEVDPTSIVTEFTLRLEQPPREATTIKSLRGEIGLLLPAAQSVFTFEDLAKDERQTKNTTDLRVNLVDSFEDDGIYTFALEFEWLDDRRAIPSHLRSLLEPEVYLELGDGSRFAQNGGLSTLVLEDSRVGFEYIFVDVPAKRSDVKLIATVPTGIGTVSVPIEFKDLPLP
ncbi:hypothetical protein Pan216_56890 [Planctomycetes bacterium Pan216]|uniref:Uncharacterized protein n=1 Tax=Kolteria novifilia TaxID=2527975 RepID=A0A518BCV7_9BACT|nr:hypothetical protein Pan216_56890 [Planctomycetes bacterium Pan216]